jgi:hypothetical protein
MGINLYSQLKINSTCSWLLFLKDKWATSSSLYDYKEIRMIEIYSCWTFYEKESLEMYDKSISRRN